MHFPVFALGWEEVVTMPHRLDKNESAVKHERYNSVELELRGAEYRTRHGGRDIWKNEGERSECGQYGQGSTCSVHLKPLLMVPGAAPEQAQPDDPVAHDHDRGEHRIACEPRFLGRRCNHH